MFSVKAPELISAPEDGELWTVRPPGPNAEHVNIYQSEEEEEGPATPAFQLTQILSVKGIAPRIVSGLSFGIYPQMFRPQTSD